MPYTIFDAGAEGRRRLAEPMIIVQPDLRIRLNAEAADVLKSAGATRVLVLWDKAKRKMALSITPDSDQRGYRLGYNTHGGAKFTAKAFLKKIGWKAGSQVRLPVHLIKGMLEVVVPAESLEAAQSIAHQPKARKEKQKKAGEQPAQGGKQ